MTLIKPTARVMIACLTDELLMVTRPVEDLRIDRIHLISYAKSPDEHQSGSVERFNYYSTINKKTVETLNNLDVEVIAHIDKPTYKFDSMMELIFEIIEEEINNESKIYVNISSGTGEYSAAAAISSMMHENVQIFSMGGKSDCVTAGTYESILQNKMHNGQLVGSYYDYHKPYPVRSLPLDKPNIQNIKSLKLFSKIPVKKRTNTNVIRNLIKQGLWEPGTQINLDETSWGIEVKCNLNTRECKNNTNYSKFKKKEAVQYQRKFIDQWLKNNLIQKDGNKYILTDGGEFYIKVFCSDSQYPIDEDSIILDL